MKKLNALVLLLLVISGAAFSQSQNIQLSISPTFGTRPFYLIDSVFHADDSSNLQIETLKFYISNIQFLEGGKVVLQEKNSFHLVDAAYKNTFQMTIENNQSVVYDALKFDLGIDSATNVSGAMGGDLDPTKGMYWTWQSGYINFKMEGKSNLCKTRNNEFEFHLGGYQQPFYALQTVSFPVKSEDQINLILDVREIFRQVDLVKQNHIMSPGAEAVSLSKVIAHAFIIAKSEK